MSEAFPRGRFCWYQLMTPDPEAAIAFYTQVTGWGTEVWEGPDGPYTMWTRGGAALGGVFPLPPEAIAQGERPHWLGYLATPDVDATSARAQELGATVMVPPEDIPSVGRFSVLADPQGATIAAFTPAEETPGHDGPPEVGEFSWHELLTTDYEAGLRFYQDLFDWDAMEAMDMGPAGIYQLYGRKGITLGGMFNRTPDMPLVGWVYYIRVEDLDTAVATVQKLGGTVLIGPMDVPGGDRIAQCQDPQGGTFALHCIGSGADQS